MKELIAVDPLIFLFPSDYNTMCMRVHVNK